MEEERNQGRAKSLSYTFAALQDSAFESKSKNSFAYLDIMCEVLTLLNSGNYLVRI